MTRPQSIHRDQNTLRSNQIHTEKPNSLGYIMNQITFGEKMTIIFGFLAICYSLSIRYEIANLDKNSLYKTSGIVESFECSYSKGMHKIDMTIIIGKLKNTYIIGTKPKCGIDDTWAIGKNAVVYSDKIFNQTARKRERGDTVWGLDIAGKKVINFDKKIKLKLHESNQSLYIGFLLMITPIVFYFWQLRKAHNKLNISKY